MQHALSCQSMWHTLGGRFILDQTSLEVKMHEANHTWAMIVGGSSGVGYAVAKQLLESDVSTFIVGNHAAKLQPAAQELSQYGTVKPIQADLYDHAGVAAVVAVAKDHRRHIKYLVNAAGYFNPTAFFAHTEKD